jgi:hypothetical protein
MKDIAATCLLAATLCICGCDPIATTQGRVVRSPVTPGAAPTPVAGALVHVKCRDLKPAEGETRTTDANGVFSLGTTGGALPDDCTVRVMVEAVSTTIGGAKTKVDDPEHRLRDLEIVLPAN